MWVPTQPGFGESSHSGLRMAAFWLCPYMTDRKEQNSSTPNYLPKVMTHLQITPLGGKKNCLDCDNSDTNQHTGYII